METLQRTANRGSISTGYDIDNSLKFEPDNTEYMRRSLGTDGNQRVFTQSMWIKRTEISYSYATPWCVGNVALRFDSNDRLEVWCYTYDGTGAGTSRTDAYRIVTPNKFRDTSAWYHLVFALDTTQGTESNRLKVYVNNERVYHDGSSDIYDQTITQNSYTRCNGTGNSSENWNQIGWYYTGNYVFAGYIAEVNFVDGLQLSPTDVGEYDEDSGIWKPKQYTGAYGTNGYHLKFDDASDLGADSSGNDNDINSIGNITAADQATDTPTNNFCTLNPLYAMTYPLAIREGGTKSVADGSVGQWQSAKGSMAVNNGKWYWEYSGFSELNTFLGIQSADANGVYNTAYAWNLPLNDNSFYIVDPNSRTEGFTTTKATTDVWAIALNMDDGEISFYRNGTQQNSTVSIDGLIGNGPYVAIISQYASATNASTNFGGYNSGKAISSAASDANGYGTFEYAPPSGYYALCTKNLAEYG